MWKHSFEITVCCLSVGTLNEVVLLDGCIVRSKLFQLSFFAAPKGCNKPMLICSCTFLLLTPSLWFTGILRKNTHIYEFKKQSSPRHISNLQRVDQNRLEAASTWLQNKDENFDCSFYLSFIISEIHQNFLVGLIFLRHM